MLDLFTVAPVGRLRLLRLLPKVFSGAHTGLDVVSFRPLRSIRIDAPGMVAYADGERIGPLPIDVEVLPALWACSPRADLIGADSCAILKHVVSGPIV
ncbi:hypothetical protein [Mycetocola miduiensis]|uniref:hypothetical protein n=1 Tax=Mycetocola miduiensis TaxID=995034 RepID=UPI000B882EF5|nr:hypothetical protein [Mycetocola miduiensis]